MNGSSTPPFAAAIPWYQSPVVISHLLTGIAAIVAGFPKNSLLDALGVYDPHTMSENINLISGTVAAITSVVGTLARVSSQLQPVTLTKLRAELHPNTLAIAEAQKASERLNKL